MMEVKNLSQKNRKGEFKMGSEEIYKETINMTFDRCFELINGYRTLCENLIEENKELKRKTSELTEAFRAYMQGNQRHDALQSQQALEQYLDKNGYNRLN